MSMLLALVRGHGSIENNLFGIRDTTVGEDACPPEAVALIRASPEN